MERFKRNMDKIKESSIFLSLFTENTEKDPQCVMQMGLAVLLDKPIYLLVQKGVAVNENLKRLARGIEYYEADRGFDEAASRLLKSAEDALDLKRKSRAEAQDPRPDGSETR